MPFLKPTGQDRAEANSRCVWLSVVRAPMAPQEIRSDKYCGVITSKYSTATGTSISARSVNRCLAIFRPLSMLKLSSKSGSLIKPFQPMVVRGFSKYTRITINKSSCNSAFRAASFCAYSRAALESWIEQGPTITIRRLSLPIRIFLMVSLAWKTPAEALSVNGNFCISALGAIIGAEEVMRTLSVLYFMRLVYLSFSIRA